MAASRRRTCLPACWPCSAETRWRASGSIPVLPPPWGAGLSPGSRPSTVRSGALASHTNISRRKRSELELAHLASHDPLTGLGNRLLFNTRLTDALNQGTNRRSVPDVGLLYIDLDAFKPVNDTYGHDAGDEVLLGVTHRLRAEIRPQDTAARMGGDEFAICAPRITGAGLSAMAERIRSALAAPHQIHGQSVRVGGSVGIHLAAAGDTMTEALRAADQAMYAVKRNRVRCSSTDPNIDGALTGTYSQAP